MTATVFSSGVGAAGSLNFKINGKKVAMGNAPQATVSLSLPAGTSNVSAHYSGSYSLRPSTSNTITFTTTPPYAPTVHGSVSYGKTTTTTVKVTIHIDVQGVKGQGAPTGMVTADDSFTCGTLTPASGRVVSKATCTAVVPITTSEDVEVNYSGDSTYAPAEISVAVADPSGGSLSEGNRR